MPPRPTRARTTYRPMTAPFATTDEVTAAASAIRLSPRSSAATRQVRPRAPLWVFSLLGAGLDLGVHGAGQGGGRLGRRRDGHAVERAPHEDDGDEEEGGREAQREAARQAHGQLHGEQAEERRELDDRVHGDRRRVLEGIAHGVAHDARGVQRRALLLEVDLDELLGVVPGAARVGHEDGLEETEEGDRDQVADEEERLEAREGERAEEDGEKDVEHALLRALRADLDDLLAVGDAGLLRAVELDVPLDELDGAVGARAHGLRRGAREPVDDGAAHDEPQEEGRVQDRQLVEVGREAAREAHDDREDHGGRADDGRADEHRLGRGLERVAGAIVLLEQVLGALEVHVPAVALLDLLLDARERLDDRQLVHRLRVVGHGAVRIDGDRHGAHAEEAEGHEAEGEDGGRLHDVAEAAHAHEVGDAHEYDEYDTHPVGAEVAGRERREDVQRGSPLARGRDDLLDVLRRGRGEDLDHLGDDGARERAARDDRRELPPKRLVAADAEAGDEQVRDDVGHAHGDERRHPDELREGRLEVHLVGVGVAALDDRLVEQIREARGDDHHDAHREDPHEELHLDLAARHGQQDEGDERDARDAVGLEAVGGGAHGVTGVVARAVGDDARVARVVLLDVEDDLHEIRADVGDLREDAARDAQRGGAQRLADREADEARARVITRQEEQDAQHHEQLDADEQHADAHARLERDGVAGIGLAAEAREGRARVRERVDADAEPGDAVAARDADEAEEQDDGHLERLEVAQDAEVDRDDGADEDLEQEDELALRDEVRLAGLVDELRDLEHGLVDRHAAQLPKDYEAEDEAEQAHDEAAREQRAARQAAQEAHLAEVRQDQARLAAPFVVAGGHRGGVGV